MTGYGRAKKTLSNRDITVEVRSVNNRYLDCTVKLPRAYIFAEDAIKGRVQKAISRGKVDVFVTIDSTGADEEVVVVNEGLARSYLEALRKLYEIDGGNYLQKKSYAADLARIPDVLNILLQILDDGRITDAQGRVVNFENTIIIMTSNAGSNQKGGSVGFGRSLTEQSKEKAMKALGEFLRPEFINRVDEIVCFNQLSEDNFRGIADIMLAELQQSLEGRGIAFTWDESVKDYLVKKSYSVAYGARNLRRAIQTDLEDPIAERIIKSYVDPFRSIKATCEDGTIKLETI